MRGLDSGRVVQTGESLGVNSATTGFLNIPNGQFINARNAANSGDVSIAGVNASNQVVLDFAGNGAMFGGIAALGSNAAATGQLRLPNNAFINGRNAANNGDVSICGVNASNQVSCDFAGNGAIFGGALTTAGAISEQTTNGAQWIDGQISESITLSTSGATTDSSANLLPANSILLGVVARVTTTITTATDWKLGDATTAGRFSGANATMVAGTTQVGSVHFTTGIASATTGMFQAAAAKLRITTTGTPGAGVIRVTVFYRQFVPPTS